MKNVYSVSSISEVCVTIQKRFAAPLTEYYQKLVELDKKGKFKFDINANLKFDLRFYLPKEVLKTPHARPKRFVIMFNGLNEILPRHFALYDRLGTSFAARGIGSILLPTPFHLNRVSIRKDRLGIHAGKENVPVEDYNIPTEQFAKNPFYLYLNFIQNLHEYRILRYLLAGNFQDVISTDQYKIDIPSKQDRDFYERFIDSEGMEISLLGHSLGGLFALSCFCDNPDSVKCCVLLNSGPTLDRMTLKGIVDERVWKETVRILNMDERLWEKTVQSLISMPDLPWFFLSKIIRNDPLFPRIRKVFFSNTLFTPKTLERVGKKLLLVIGGKEGIISPESIKRLEPVSYGLNIIQISRLSHFLIGDVAFERWYPRLFRMLSDFIQDPVDTALS